MLHGMMIGAIAGGIGVLAFGLLLPRRRCGACSALLPRFRTPTSAGQALRGGWTCPACGAELDRKGRPRGSSASG